jgi:F-type H+-transporting ATPase subunit a
MAEHASNALDPNELFSHVKDSTELHVPRILAPSTHGHIELPQPIKLEKPLISVHSGNPMIDSTIEPLDFKFTKYMFIELVAALLICVSFIALARALKGGAIARGRFRNMLEAILFYFRDHVARPAIGGHDADRFVPFLWTIFLFVLTCNLFGMIPWLGSPTASLATTGALALITFLTVMGASIMKFGLGGSMKSLVPHMDLPLAIKVPMLLLMFPIEVLGLLIRHSVLAVRLLANMMGGHVVLAVIVAFIAASAQSAWWYAVAPGSVLGATALSLLELLVAFLQAYIFTFLSALFIGMALHPH